MTDERTDERTDEQTDLCIELRYAQLIIGRVTMLTARLIIFNYQRIFFDMAYSNNPLSLSQPPLPPWLLVFL